jgi:hypothetical protein
MIYQHIESGEGDSAEGIELLGEVVWPIEKPDERNEDTWSKLGLRKWVI